MRFSEMAIPGVIAIDPDVHADARGCFVEAFHAEKYGRAGIPSRFVQDNQSASVATTLRGLHFQLRRPQGKLVRAVSGEIWDVVVDLRPESPAFGRWLAVTLSGENFRQLYVPPGCAHGFCVLSPHAVVSYKCTEFYDPADEVGVAFDDPTLAIAWPVTTPLLSPRDRSHARLDEVVARLQCGTVGS